jgi:hypothetical protein
VVEESAGIVGSFDEGWSNRQVWHAAAQVAAGAWLDRDDVVERSGARLARLLERVGNDGLWHEGENYHLFALRGFLLGAEILRCRGPDLYAATRLGAMYPAPLATVLPDLTLPARGDAPFGVSVRQPRFAELWEMGRARAPDQRLDGILARLYAPDAPEGEDGGLVELAEQEWNRPAHRQHRDRLGWKALLWMRPDEPAAPQDRDDSAWLEDRGVAVVRSGRDRMVMVECGGRGGGHGHPDRLHLSVYWHTAVLADFGTGSYVLPSLHWYRSALAHNVPVRSGAGQTAGAAACDAFAGNGRWQWCRIAAEGLLGRGTAVRRSVFVGPDLVLDVVRVDAPPEVPVDLALHPLAGLDLPVEPAPPGPPAPADGGHETGYDRIETLGRVGSASSVALGATGLALNLAPRAGETLLVARAPGPPGVDFADGAPLPFLIRRAAGAGRWVQCLAPAAAQCRIREDGPDVLVEIGHRTVRVIEGGDGAVVQEAGLAAVRLPARGETDWPGATPATPPSPVVVRIPLVSRKPTLDDWPAAAPAVELAGPHYRRSEDPYDPRGGARARLEVVAWGATLCFGFRVIKPEVVVRPADAPDPALDNEPADIHSDGVQCYVGRDRWAGFLVIPELDTGGVRVRPVAGTAARAVDADGESRRTARGYDVLVRCSAGAALRPGERLRFTAVVNEMRPGRQRRAGQLALAGGGWVYLRGDRESPDTAQTAEIA